MSFCHIKIVIIITNHNTNAVKYIYSIRMYIRDSSLFLADIRQNVIQSGKPYDSHTCNP